MRVAEMKTISGSSPTRRWGYTDQLAVPFVNGSLTALFQRLLKPSCRKVSAINSYQNSPAARPNSTADSCYDRDSTKTILRPLT